MMEITINPNNVINEYIDVTEEYEENRKKQKQQYPNGQYLFETTPLNKLHFYIDMKKTEAQLQSIHLCFRNINLDRLARVVRKWYKRTSYQYLLSSDMEDKLLQFFTTA